MGHGDRHGHQLGRLVAGEANHHALVAGADGLDLGLRHLTGARLQSLIDAHGYVRALLVKRDGDSAGVGVKTVV